MKFVFFSVSENGENGLGDEGAYGGNAPQNFLARTAPEEGKGVKAVAAPRGVRGPRPP